MQIQAISLGEAVPVESFDAVLHSSFQSAVNVRLLKEDRLLTVLISDSYELPQGIRITKKDAPLHTLEPGRRAALRGGMLRFESYPLSIDLRGAPVWKCHVAGLAADMDTPGSQRSWSIAWELLNRWQRLISSDIIADHLFQSQVGSLLSQKLSVPVMQLVASADCFDLQRSIHAAQSLVGLGPGVTPSGDDILVGFLAGLWSVSGRNPLRQTFIRSFGEGLLLIAWRTNEISRTYLYHASQGQFSSPLSTLVERIVTGADVEYAIQDAMRVGHSSGMDSVTGLLVGLAVWTEPVLPYFIPLPTGEQNSGNPYGYFATSD